MVQRLTLAITTLIILSVGSMVALSWLGYSPLSAPSPLPTRDAATEAAIDLVANSLGPYPTHRPAQGNCYTAMTKPVVVKAAPPIPPAEALRRSATATRREDGGWLVRWDGGEWQADPRNGTVTPLNAKAAVVEATSKTPCPDQP